MGDFEVLTTKHTQMSCNVGMICDYFRKSKLFQKVPDFSINFDKNEFFGTRKCFQDPKLKDVLPTDDFQNRQIRKGVVHRYDHFRTVLDVNVG